MGSLGVQYVLVPGQHAMGCDVGKAKPQISRVRIGGGWGAAEGGYEHFTWATCYRRRWDLPKKHQDESSMAAKMML